MLDRARSRPGSIGDGRDISSQDRNEENIRPSGRMTKYSIRYPRQSRLSVRTSSCLHQGFRRLRGTGRHPLHDQDVTDLLLLRIKDRSSPLQTKASLASALGVADVFRSWYPLETPREQQVDLLGIIVNIADYTIGADKNGGSTCSFDFDIDSASSSTCPGLVALVL